MPFLLILLYILLIVINVGLCADFRGYNIVHKVVNAVDFSPLDASQLERVHLYCIPLCSVNR